MLNACDIDLRRTQDHRASTAEGARRRARTIPLRQERLLGGCEWMTREVSPQPVRGFGATRPIDIAAAPRRQTRQTEKTASKTRRRPQHRPRQPRPASTSSTRSITEWHWCRPDEEIVVVAVTVPGACAHMPGTGSTGRLLPLSARHFPHAVHVNLQGAIGVPDVLDTTWAGRGRNVSSGMCPNVP